MSRLEKESFFPNLASTSQEGLEEVPGLGLKGKLNVTLLSSEWQSLKGGLSTISRELAIQLAKRPDLKVSVYLPQCSENDKKAASSHKVQLIEAEELTGFFDPINWLTIAPANHVMDYVIGHGVLLGRYAQIFKHKHQCKWIQVVHTAPEELGKYKTYPDAISKGMKEHEAEVNLCEKADQVVAVGPKLKEAFSRYLRPCKKDQAVMNLTPSIFSEFSHVKQPTEERQTFDVLVLGRGESEDFQLKGYDIVAEAIVRLGSPFRLMFVGAPSGKEDKVTKQLLDLGINRSQLTVRCFNENREQLAKLFCEVDLATMPSRTEGFGLVALEALSASLPVLVSGNSGLGEALKKVPYGSQWVVDSENPQDWANAIRTVREKGREIRLEETKLLSEKYAEKFSWDNQCKLLVEMMRKIAAGTPAQERDSPSIEGRYTSQGNLQSNQGVANSWSLDEGSAEKLAQRSFCNGGSPFPTKRGLVTHGYEGSAETLASKESQRSLCNSGSPSPKKRRLATHCYEDHKNVVKFFKAEYKRRSLLKPLPWCNSIQLPLEDVYTRLKICSRRKTDFRLENNVVDFCDIFESFAKGQDTMTLVEGSPGIGKTTFCLKVAYDWAKETPGKENLHVLHGLEFVLLLKCRDIEGDLMEAISEQLLPEDMDQKAKDDFINYIKDINNHEKILIILDGLDELPEKSKDHVDKLLNRRILPFCYVLATCRQERGISVRAEFSFDVLLQIEGFTEENAFKYITKHFENVCPEQSVNVEKLIRQIQENASLHALCTNPLNVLLLCVVFEDYEEKLPSSRTKLYQIIVHCLLRRYCTKHNMKASDDDSSLEQQFQESILVLGQLAWECLLTDRHCFPEAELVKFESLNKDLAARFLGLVFKEASLKRIKPQHEYHYLHKTFQEYLAALYLVHLLLTKHIQVFECFGLKFRDVVTKYRQVFLFVIGVLDKTATILFKQIGEVLLSDWEWLECREDEATFFIESFSESENAEQMAVTLCTYIPFPQDIEIDNSFYSYPENVLLVLKTCKTFSQLQLPLSLSLLGADSLEDDEVDTFKDALVSSLPFEIVNISGNEMTMSVATALCEGLCEPNSTLKCFFLDVLHSIPPCVAEIIGKGLAISQTLTSVTFTLTAEWGEAWASALEKGLSAETPLASVVLQIFGSMSDTAIRALVKVLLNKSLLSLTLLVMGEMQDLLASAVGSGLAEVTVLESFALGVFGKMTSQGAFSLQSGFLQNHSLHSLVVRVYGELPNNWTSVVQNVFSSKRSLICCDLHPNPISQVTDAQINHLNTVVLENGFISDHSFTLNLWGELNCVGAEALGKVLEESSLSTLTLNVQGKLADGVAHCLAKYLKPHKTLSSVTVNTWCELTEEGRAALQGSSKTQIHSFALDYQTKPSQDSFSQSHTPSVKGPSELRAIFDNAKESQTRTLNLTINNHSDTGEDWAHGLSDGLAKTPSLITLTLTINNFSDASEDWAHGLSDGLATNSSVTTLYLIINNFSGMSGKWGYTLGNVLAKFASLTELSLLVADHSTSEFEGNLANSLLMNTSLTTLRITINCGVMTTFWKGLGDCLKQCVSLATLTLTINNFSDVSRDWADQLDIDLAKSSSITTLNLVVNNYYEMWGTWGDWLSGCLAGNTSLTTLSLTFNNYCQCNDDSSGEWADGLAIGLANNASLTTLCLAISDYNNANGEWAYRLSEAWVDNTSLTTLTLRVNNVACGEVRGDWLQDLFNRLSKSESLATLKFTVNNQDEVGGNIACNFELCNCLEKCQSLTSLDVTVSLYGVAN